MWPGFLFCGYILYLYVFICTLGAFCIPVYIPYTLTGRWTLGRGLCKLWLVMDYLLCSASVFNIVLISYDRFLSVTRAVSRTSVSHLSNGSTARMVLDAGSHQPGIYQGAAFFFLNITLS